jgi:branched-chain amino acid transport system substrate-binding protein
VKKREHHDTVIQRATSSTASTRRRFLRTTAAAAFGAVAPGLFSKPAYAAGRPIKIGFVNPRTGILAPFGEGNDFVLSGIRKLVADGITIHGTSHPVLILDKDSESVASRAAKVASGLIKSDKVDLMLAASTVDTVNPVSDQCEMNGVPCITTDAPWQLYYFGRGGDAGKGFDWTYHFFWGTDDLIAVFMNLWGSIPTNKVVGALWTDDSEGKTYSDPKLGFPAFLQPKGFTLVDPGRFPRSTSDYSSQIDAFKRAKVEILTGVLPPPTFATFWNQARGQGFKPKIATIAKALLFPSALEALGNHGGGLTTEVWWSPNHPYKSALTGEYAAEFCAAYEDEVRRQWTQPIGFLHALFEIGLDVLKRSQDIDSPTAIRDAIRTTDYHSIVGHIAWDGKPVKNIAKTSLAGGQWVPGWKFKHWEAGQKFRYDLVIVNNETDPAIGVQRKLEPLLSEA